MSHCETQACPCIARFFDLSFTLERRVQGVSKDQDYIMRGTSFLPAIHSPHEVPSRMRCLPNRFTAATPKQIASQLGCQRADADRMNLAHPALLSNCNKPTSQSWYAPNFAAISHQRRMTLHPQMLHTMLREVSHLEIANETHCQSAVRIETAWGICTDHLIAEPPARLADNT